MLQQTLLSPKKTSSDPHTYQYLIICDTSGSGGGGGVGWGLGQPDLQSNKHLLGQCPTSIQSKRICNHKNGQQELLFLKWELARNKFRIPLQAEMFLAAWTISISTAFSMTHRPPPDYTWRSQETDIHAADEIGTRNPRKRGAAEPHLRPRGHRDRLVYCYCNKILSVTLRLH
jgi:hypothetical protein